MKSPKARLFMKVFAVLIVIMTMIVSGPPASALEGAITDAKDSQVASESVDARLGTNGDLEQRVGEPASEVTDAEDPQSDLKDRQSSAQSADAPSDTTGIESDTSQSSVSTEGQPAELAPQANDPSISYRVHVQTTGDQDWKKDGEEAGTTGQSKRLEAIWIELGSENTESGGISYRTHVQTYGWQDWQSSGQESGTHGQAKRLEAIQIKLSGNIATTHDLYYRVHAQHYGWLGWAKNGESAGTAGKSYRLESIQILLVAKNGTAPSSEGSVTTDSFIGAEEVSLSAHVQGIGWMQPVGNGEIAGTTGQSRRVEALGISLRGIPVPGSIEGNAHVQGIGWQGWRGEEIGTTGQSRRVEAIQLRLTGEAADRYDIYYRVHVQGGGWMAWAKNGESAGTASISTRVEALQAVLVQAGSSVPASDDQTISIPFVESQSLSYNVHLSDGSWQGWAESGAVAGQPGASTINALQITTSGDLPASVSYATHESRVGWTPDVLDGATSGSGENNVEAFSVSLSGEASRLFTVWYRASVRGIGWTDWAQNGNPVGSTGQSLPIDALEIRIMGRAVSAPGSTVAPMYDRVEATLRGLSLEQKVAQLFVVTPEQLTGEDIVTNASENMRGAISRYPVGGIIYFAANLQNPGQTQGMLQGTRNYSLEACGLAPFQCVDEEGGRVARIANNGAFGVANVGDMQQIGATGSADLARSTGNTMGSYLRSLGFNVDLAPVADISTSQSGVMDRRSFGRTPELVASMVSAQVQGFNDSGILCTAKHFPGIGASEGDSHQSSIYTNKNAGELGAWELVPFRAAIDAGVPMIMVSHLSCTQFADGTTLPASMNPSIINGLLRGQLGYDGLVITDALQMGAVSGVTSADRQGALVIHAGGDLILMPVNFNQAYDGLLAAVRSGEISEARINESVRRVIHAKNTI